MKQSKLLTGLVIGALLATTPYLLGAMFSRSRVLNGVFTCTTTAQPISSTSISIKSITVKAEEGNTNEVFLGGVAVTAADGIDVPAGAAWSDDIKFVERVSCITGSGTEKIRWIGSN